MSRHVQAAASMVSVVSMGSLSGARGEEASEGCLELAASPAIGGDARHAGSEILRVPRIAHQDDAEGGDRRLKRVEQGAVRRVEMRVVEKEQGRVGAAGRLSGPGDL